MLVLRDHFAAATHNHLHTTYPDTSNPIYTVLQGQVQVTPQCWWFGTRNCGIPAAVKDIQHYKHRTAAHLCNPIGQG